ncbi:uncharacterized protein si:dkey-56m19.5 [Heptranchias perlo]|uniref:uncharacterized protein si:dkey-56m19.5 n=1 Tax=Heptranchias perlo TaxID=212740 RepID=UPI0035599461
MSCPTSHSVQSRLGGWTRSLCCCRGGEAQSVNSMGGRLSRKKRGYNVNDPKESKTTVESTENPEVKEEEPENQDASKEQLKTTGELSEEKPETEAPKIADETPAEKQTDLVTADVKTEAKPTADVPTLSGSTDSDNLDRSSDVQESVTSTSLVEATKAVPDQLLVIDDVPPEVQSSSTPDTGSRAEVIDVPVLSEVQSSVIPDSGSNGETEDKSALDKGSVTEAPKDPSTEKSSLGDHAATQLVEDEQLEENNCVSLEDIKVESDKVLVKTSAEKFHDVMSEQESIVSQEKVSLESNLKEIEDPTQAMKSGAIPKLAEIAEETPIDVVLKNEMAKCADLLEKDIVGPDTQDEGQKVSEPLHPTVQIVADVKTEQSAEYSIEKADHMQDSSIQENGNVKVFEAHNQLLESSGNISVDTSSEDSCSAPKGVTDVVQAESIPENVCHPKAEKEVTETKYEQTVELISHQESIEEISLLKTSSELIPDIKLTVYTEALQDEKIEMTAELPSKGSTDETLPKSVPDTTADPLPLKEVLAEKQLTSSELEEVSSVEMVLETKVSSDQEMVKLDETVEDPVPESISSPNVGAPSPTEVIKTRKTSSTNGVFVDGETSQNESTSKTEEDSLSEIPVANGTSVDEVRGQSESTSKAEVYDQIETAKAEEHLQAASSDELKSDPIECKTTEQGNANQPLEESGCLKLDNQTLNSGLLVDVNAE